jgi:hypothetical protein
VVLRSKIPLSPENGSHFDPARGSQVYNKASQKRCKERSKLPAKPRAEVSAQGKGKWALGKGGSHAVVV